MAMLVSQNGVKFLSDHFRKSPWMLLEDNIVPERHVGQRETRFDSGATDFAIYDQRCWILRQVTHGLHDSCRGLPQGETSCWKSRWQRCCPAPREPWSVSCWKIRVQRPRKYKFQNAQPQQLKWLLVTKVSYSRPVWATQINILELILGKSLELTKLKIFHS